MTQVSNMKLVLTVFLKLKLTLAIVDVGLKPHVKTEITLLELQDPELGKSLTHSANGFGFKGLGDGFEIGVDQVSGGAMIGSSIHRNSDKKFTENLSKCELNLFRCKTTKARANLYFQRFQVKLSFVYS